MYENEKCAVIIAAGGRGSRSGLDYPKQLYKLCGREIIMRTIDVFEPLPFVGEIIIVSEAKSADEVSRICGGCEKLKAVVRGGDTRQSSVRIGLEHVSAETGIVLIHDAVRPFAGAELIKNVYEGARLYGACIPAVKSRDTVKIAGMDGYAEDDPPDRNKVVFAQTPQGFSRTLIEAAYESAFVDGKIYSDDAGVVAAAGIKVKIIDGNVENIKITTSFDLLFAGYLVNNVKL